MFGQRPHDAIRVCGRAGVELREAEAAGFLLSPAQGVAEQERRFSLYENGRRTAQEALGLQARPR